MTPEKIARINELAKKKKTEGLTPEKVVDEEGNDVTPEKLRQIQREKGLHGRSLDDPES